MTSSLFPVHLFQDVAFTILYTLELALNLFVNWLVPFLTDGWSVSACACPRMLTLYCSGLVDGF
jgi:hypothetical protein